MQLTKQKIWKSSIYLLFWAVSFFIGLEAFSRTGEVRTIDVIYTFLFHIPFVFVVSVHSFHLIPNFLAKSNFWAYGITFICLLGTAYPIYNLSFSVLADWIFPGYYLVGVYSYLEVIGFAVVYIVISSSLEFGRSWFESLRTKSRITELESEKKVSELKALRAQVNPHFLFNSLNTIYSEALKKSDKAPKLILKLSDMLRYVVDKIDEEKVSLQEEVEYLTHFVDLHKERLNHPEKVRFTTKGDFSGKEIAPLLLIIFVENCFKHSDLTDDDAFISISLIQHNKELILKCRNTIHKEMPKDKNAIATGIENAKRRLELAYENKHSLDISQEGDVYEIKLTMQVEE